MTNQRHRGSCLTYMEKPPRQGQGQQLQSRNHTWIGRKIVFVCICTIYSESHESMRESWLSLRKVEREVNGTAHELYHQIHDDHLKSKWCKYMCKAMPLNLLIPCAFVRWLHCQVAKDRLHGQWHDICVRCLVKGCLTNFGPMHAGFIDWSSCFHIWRVPVLSTLADIWNGLLHLLLILLC